MKKKNSEVQSRRDFFKNAAKAALPILGIAVLTSNPIVAKAVDIMGCTGTCHETCYGSCEGCRYTCSGGCKNACGDGCKYTCSGTCKGSSR